MEDTNTTGTHFPMGKLFMLGKLFPGNYGKRAKLLNGKLFPGDCLLIVLRFCVKTLSKHALQTQYV